MDKSVITVAFATDKNYALYTCVAMSSIMKNANPDYFFRFVILVSPDFLGGGVTRSKYLNKL